MKTLRIVERSVALIMFLGVFAICVWMTLKRPHGDVAISWGFALLLALNCCYEFFLNRDLDES